ncbi:MAG: transglycosylase SLT domain-containing protein, partial [Paracoccaceae bacterium]|nr:transglycosylase SLT domain-containing protein [Paracoccaceae bacterium]
MQAARESGVPLSVLRAISLTETGRQRDGAFKPWPWTVNMEGAGIWFDSEDEARAYVFRHHQRGARSYDVGCFQLNYRWHGQHFASIEEMFDPLANARYAARFLSDLHAETGDWSRAAGAYHSRTREYADRYRTRFDRIRARLDGAPPPEELPVLASGAPVPMAAPEAEPAPSRVNGFPLLQALAAP